MKTMYMGDGVYANYDGYGTWLHANNNDHPTDKVYLEPEVLRNLVNFVSVQEAEAKTMAAAKIVAAGKQ